MLSARDKVQPQTETVWRQANECKVPVIIFVNKMDRDDAYFDKCVESVRDRLHTKPLPLQMPIGMADTFKGIIDLLTMKAYIPEDDFNYIIPKPMSFLQIKHMRALLNNAGFSQINITGITNCVNLEALNEPLIRMLEPILAEHNPNHSIIYYVIAAIK